MTAPSIEIITPGRLTPADALAICQLGMLTWPSKTGETPAEHAAALLARRDSGSESACQRLWHVVRAPSAGPGVAPTLLAKAEGFLRIIQTTRGPLAILALAGVCAHEGARGKGLGSAVVQSALTRVDSGQLPFGYWQTTPNRIGFYQRLGGCVATNPVINSLAENPQANPFWDPITFRYPNDTPTRQWPAGIIDLCGPGY